MTAFVIRRLLQAILVLFATAVIVFVARLCDRRSDGDPAALGCLDGRTGAGRPPRWASTGRCRCSIGHFLWNALHGDFGRSFVFNQPAMAVIFERLPATLELTLTALAMSLLIGIPLGLWAGTRPNSLVDESVMTGSILGFCLPNFWQGMMLIMIFAVWLGWLPSTGRGETGTVLGITHLASPRSTASAT